MKITPQGYFAVRPLVLALHGVFAVLGMQSAIAAEQDPAVLELTQLHKQIEVGAGYVSDNSFKAGDYTGLNRQGLYGIVNFDLRGGASYESDSARRWRITGNNLGLDSREVTGEYSNQGSYRFTFGYDEIVKLRSDSFQTPFLGAGTSELTLPSNWVAGANTAGMTKLAASMHDFDVSLKRARTNLGFSAFITPQWEFKANFSNEDKDGTKILGATFGNNGGNPRAVLLPEPIDFNTKQMDMAVAFTSDKAQFQVGYYASLFTDNINSVRWQNPFNNTPWGVAVGYPNFGQMGTMPDNQFHQLNLSGGYNFTPTTRLTVSGSRGYMKQNEAFLPYTSISSLTQTTPLPRTSLDGEVVTTAFNLKLTARPMQKLNVSAGYRYDDRDNRTPQAQYDYIGGDSANQVAINAASDRIRTNLPRSSKLQAINLDANYALQPGTALKIGADHETIERTYSEVAKVRENTYRGEVRHAFSEAMQGSIAYSNADRKGSSYIDNAPFLASYTSAAYINSLTTGCTAGQSCVWDNLPGQRKFYLADRKREKVTAMVNLSPTEAISVQGSVSSNRDDYHNSPYGLTSANGWSATMDATYVLNESFTANAFFTREEMKSVERGRQLGGTRNNAFTAADLDWTNTTKDKTNTFGLGIKHQGLMGGKLELGSELIVVHGRTPISTVVGAAISGAPNSQPARPLPDLTTRSESISINAKYKLDNKSAIRFGYMYQHLRTSDWAYEGVGPATLANVVGTNEVPPSYRVHSVGASYVYRFD